HSDAQNNLADLYEDGKGVAQNKTLAAFWYLKSAQQGNRHAQFQIAWDYNAGEGVDQDYKQAMYWYLKAAAQESVGAYVNIGYNPMQFETGRADYPAVRFSNTRMRR
ncbi:tetratricopeptide repeat protein, partial [Escherichia sp. SS-MK2]